MPELTMDQFAERLKREEKRRAMVEALLHEKDGVERRLQGTELRLLEVGRDKEAVKQLTERRDYLRARIKAIDASLRHQGSRSPDDVA
jgi:hypothetical protein